MKVYITFVPDGDGGEDELRQKRLRELLDLLFEKARQHGGTAEFEQEICRELGVGRGLPRVLANLRRASKPAPESPVKPAEESGSR